LNNLKFKKTKQLYNKSCLSINKISWTHDGLLCSNARIIKNNFKNCLTLNLPINFIIIANQSNQKVAMVSTIATSTPSALQTEVAQSLRKLDIENFAAAVLRSLRVADAVEILDKRRPSTMMDFKEAIDHPAELIALAQKNQNFSRSPILGVEAIAKIKEAAQLTAGEELRAETQTHASAMQAIERVVSRSHSALDQSLLEKITAVIRAGDGVKRAYQTMQKCRYQPMIERSAFVCELQLRGASFPEISMALDSYDQAATRNLNLSQRAFLLACDRFRSVYRAATQES
jgi:hypothetical protein